MSIGLWRTVLVVLVLGMAACARQRESTERADSQRSDAAVAEDVSAPAEAPSPTEPQSRTEESADSSSATLATTQQSDSDANASQLVDPAALLKRTAQFYLQAESLSVETEMVMKIKMQGNDESVRMQREIALERPNKLLLRNSGDLPGIDVYQDGQSLVMHMAATDEYTEEPSPESFAELVLNPRLASGTMTTGIVLNLLGEEPFQTLMQGVTDQQYLGLEEIDGERVHHLRFQQDQFDWEVSISADGDPLLKRVMFDMSKTLQMFPDEGEEIAAEMTFTETFQNWTIDAPIAAEKFVFTPPDGAKKVDSFFEGMFGAEAPSPLIGQAAPPVELDLLDGGRLRLAGHAGKEFVMLDFWATWCGPCVEELPLLVEVAAEYRDKGVVFYAVNQQEDADTIRAFLDEKKLSLTVALDHEGAVGEAFNVSGIPMLALIDKAGIVQAVHVGYSPAIKQTLRQELDDLLAGKNLAEEALQARAAQETAIEAFGIDELWAVPGRFSGVAVDPQTRLIYSVDLRGNGTVFDAHGAELRSFTIDGSAGFLRAAQLAGDEGIELLAFGSWGPSVTAYLSDGTQLWNEAGGQGIDDVWAADLDGDGRDEVIVGYNGATGLHVFDHDGVRRWQNTDLGNVWHVTAGDVNGDGAQEVVTTSAAGQVHVFSPTGERRDNWDVPLYASMVRIGPGTADRPGQIVYVIGTADAGQQMIALASGTTLWTLDLPARVIPCESLSISPDGQWAAAGLRGGLVVVVDTSDGRLIAQLEGQGQRPEVNWLPGAGDQPPQLLIATGTDLRACHIHSDNPANAANISGPALPVEDAP